MFIRRNIYLVTTSLAVAGMVGAPLQGFAQDADQQVYTQSQAEDPPARVGRLAVIEGTVSTHSASETQWSPAVLNAPVSDGDAFWTEPQATAEIEVTASSLWMSGATEFDLTTLNDTSLHASEPQGETYLHLRSLQPGETYTIETPRGTVTLATDGRYEIAAGDTQDPTTVTVLDGAAQITGSNISLQIGANQTASITGDTSFQGSVGPATQDAFLASMLQREQPPPSRGVAPPPVVAQMTGATDLDRYGSWQDNADYGNVWYPDVGADWAPYREGRWSYVAPWGWTWIDAAPWGFAPFHYGRWVRIGPRWGWAPVYPGYQPEYRPVYAPALVTFFGVGAGVGVGIGVGIGLGLGAAFGPGANIGWVPLGPREPYFPPYRVSRVYVNRVNITNIRNVTNIYNEVNIRRTMPIDRYANARAAVVVPARTMVESRPVAGAYRRPDPKELSGAHGLVDRAPVAPGRATLGLTPRVAKTLNVPSVDRRAAPGPQVNEAARPNRNAPPPLRPARPGETPPARRPLEPGNAQGGPNRPETRPAGPGPQTPAEPMRRGNGPGAPGPRIEPGPAARPALRTPGETPMGRNNEVTTRPPAVQREPGPAARPEAPNAERRAQPGPAETRPAPQQRGPQAAPERNDTQQRAAEQQRAQAERQQQAAQQRAAEQQRAQAERQQQAAQQRAAEQRRAQAEREQKAAQQRAAEQQRAQAERQQQAAQQRAAEQQRAQAERQQQAAQQRAAEQQRAQAERQQQAAQQAAQQRQQAERAARPPARPEQKGQPPQ